MVRRKYSQKKPESFNWNWKGKDKAHYGMPVKLFSDKDKDGVPNVFDCAPRNPKKQDVIAPPRMAGNIMGMYHGREARRFAGQQARQQAAELARLQKLEQERLAELQRLATPGPVTYRITQYGSGSGSLGSSGPATVAVGAPSPTSTTITPSPKASSPITVTQPRAAPRVSIVPAPVTSTIRRVVGWFKK
jgi:hypothetical protein